MKRVIALVLSLLMMFSLASCADEKAVSEAKELLVIDPAEYGEVTLKIASLIEGEGAREILGKIAEKYSYDFPNVKIEYEYFTSEDDIQAILQAGAQYDAVEVRGEDRLRRYVKENWLMNLSEYIASWDEGYTLSTAAKTVLKSIIEFDAHGNKIAVPYVIPYGIYYDALYYRADRLSELEIDSQNPEAIETDYNGITAPRHWGTLLTMAEAMRALPSNAAEIDIALSDNATDYNFIDTIYWSKIGFDRIDSGAAAYYMYANRELGEEYGKTIFSTPDAKEALGYYKDLNERLIIDKFERESETAAIEAFINGEANFLIAGPQGIKLCEEGMADGEWDVVPYPVEKGGSAVRDDFRAWGITWNSSNSDVMAHFLRYLCNSDNNTYLARELSFIPVHSDAIELDTYFNDSKFWAFTSMGKRTNAFKYATQPRMYEAYDGYADMANKLYADFLAEKVTADELLKTLDDYWIAAFEEHGKLW